jgi:hypothetical protein
MVYHKHRVQVGEAIFKLRDPAARLTGPSRRFTILSARRTLTSKRSSSRTALLPPAMRTPLAARQGIAVTGAIEQNEGAGGLRMRVGVRCKLIRRPAEAAATREIRIGSRGDTTNCVWPEDRARTVRFLATGLRFGISTKRSRGRIELFNTERRTDTLRVFESSETPEREWVSRRWEGSMWKGGSMRTGSIL